MKDTQRINCPPSDLSRSERIDAIVNEFNRWISTSELIQLVGTFGGDLARSSNCR